MKDQQTIGIGVYRYFGRNKMRVWHPIPAICLDTKRLVAEHLEITIIMRVLVGISTGWWFHPEVKRWRGHTNKLFERHEKVVAEFERRGFKHKSPIPPEYIVDNVADWPEPWEPLRRMKEKLACKIKGM